MKGPSENIPMKTFHRLWTLAVLSFLFQLPAALAQSSATVATVTVRMKGSQQGELTGELTTKGREGQHEVLAYNHEIVVPRDSASGLPSGKRQHQPFRLVKLINKASPLLVNAIARNETFDLVEITLWATDPTGSGIESKLLTYSLSNARLVDLRPWMPNKSDRDAAGYKPAEEIAFVYESITVTYNGSNGQTIGSDSVAPAP